MKKSLTRKLTIAVIALVFAVVSLSTSTYAWFTMSNTAQIDGFTADVKAGEGIEIAITATGSPEEIAAAKWYTGNVPADVVKTAFEANKFTKFQDLTRHLLNRCEEPVRRALKDAKLDPSKIISSRIFK